MKPRIPRLTGIILPVLAFSLVYGCTVGRKAASLNRTVPKATIGLPPTQDVSPMRLSSLLSDNTTESVTADEGESIIMNAVKDENGEMVATDVIPAAMVSARFRNLAERRGSVDISFDVTVPSTMRDSHWQLRLFPDMEILGDHHTLEPVIITGSQYRKAQLRGYQQYNKFLESIITDTTLLINRNQLEVFLKRNIPQIYRFRNDTSVVSDEVFLSHWGVSEQRALKHYTIGYLVRRNRRREGKAEKMYRKYIKSPIGGEGLRLDTVLVREDGDFIYRYTQSVNAVPGLRKIDVRLGGEILQQDKRIYTIPDSDPLTFYISSLSSLIDESPRYRQEITLRNVEVNTACYIDFEQGKDEVNPGLGNNRSEIKRIKDNIAELLSDKELAIDSVVVTATCSPEGTYKSNTALALRRSGSVGEYFSRFIAQYSDSLYRSYGRRLSINGEELHWEDSGSRDLMFLPRSNPENWEALDVLVRSDSLLSVNDKESYWEIRSIKDPDSREQRLQGQAYYLHLREALYPRLRTVKFAFHLHRTNLDADTVTTTIRDYRYMEGLQAIKDRDYTKALSILRPYSDYNTAVACLALDYDNTALGILQSLKDNVSPQKDYLMAIAYCRIGNEDEAVEHYLSACRKDRSMIYRGNLDPEISSLTRRLGISFEDDITN